EEDLVVLASTGVWLIRPQFENCSCEKLLDIEIFEGHRLEDIYSFDVNQRFFCFLSYSWPGVHVFNFRSKSMKTIGEVHSGEKFGALSFSDKNFTYLMLTRQYLTNTPPWQCFDISIQNLVMNWLQQESAGELTINVANMDEKFRWTSEYRNQSACPL